MASLSQQWGDIWERVKQSPAELPTRIMIPRKNVVNEKLSAIQPGVHYFQVIINEMYLTKRREWFSVYDPMVFIVSEFNYDKKRETVPYLVGPMMIEKNGQKAPAGMIFSDTRVAGLHPYRGGGLALSLILCRVKRDNYARKLMQVLENTAKVLDFSSMLSTYVKVAGIVMDGVDLMLDSGDLQPHIGLRKEFDVNELESQYFALIDIPEGNVNQEEFWVNHGQLCVGKSKEDTKPFREADYVLYSITSTEERDDISVLPFYPLWERIQTEALVPDDNSWQRAKGDLLSLYQNLVLSPDLVPDQAAMLNQKYKKEIVQLHDNAQQMSTLGPGKKKEISEVEVELRQAAEILDLK
jgi:hypothetical protein